jgi:hypothetical protein
MRAQATTIEDLLCINEGPDGPGGLLRRANFGLKSFDELQTQLEPFGIKLSKPGLD